MSGIVVPFQKPVGYARQSDLFDASLTPSKVQRLISPLGSPLVDLNKLPAGHTTLGGFFETLRRTRVLFIEQSAGKDIELTDTAYTLRDPAGTGLEPGNGPDKISIGEMVELISEVSDEGKSPREVIERFAAEHDIRIEDRTKDKTPSKTRSLDISNMGYFRPEQELISAIVYTDNEKITGHEYQISTGDGKLWVFATNFDLVDAPLSPLLFLMIHASDEFEEKGVKDTEHIKIIRFNIGGSDNSEIIFPYARFLEEIDRAIARVYGNVHGSLPTGEKRRNFILKKYVTPLLDPNNRGGEKKEDTGEK